MKDDYSIRQCLDADPAKWSVRSPWAHEHSGGTNDAPGSDAAIFNAAQTMPGYPFYREGDGILPFCPESAPATTPKQGLRDFEGLSTPSHTREKNTDEKIKTKNI